MEALPNRLKEFREAADLTQDEECDRLQEIAWKRFGREIHPNRELISKYERSAKPVSEFYRQLFCHLFRVSDEELGLAPARATVETSRLAQSILGSRMDPSLVESAEQASDRLCREYSITSPADLLPRVHGHLRHLQEVLLGGGTRLPHRTYARLLAATGWTYVVLANVHGDLGQHEAAQTSRDTALHLGREIGDGHIAGWTFELASYFAMYGGLPQDALAAAEEGVRNSPPESAAFIANILKTANAWARLGNRFEAERAIERAGDRVAVLPVPEYPDHHYAGFDPPKFDLFAPRTYAWLNMSPKAEYHARRVIEQCGDRMSDPKRLRWTPGRLSMARLDLASALAGQGEIEEACRLATQALQPILRRSIVGRAGEVDALLLNRHPDSADVKRFHDHYLEARRSLRAVQSGS